MNFGDGGKVSAKVKIDVVGKSKDTGRNHLILDMIILFNEFLH